MQTIQNYTPTIRWAGEGQSDFIPHRRRMERADATPLIKPDGVGDCPACSFGLVEPPPLTGSLPLYRERCLQYEMRELTFCECQAGQLYRRFLARRAVTENAREAKDAHAFNRSEAAK